MTLFKIDKNGNCIGGFTSAKWELLQNYNSKYVSDSTAMLFNLTTRQLFRCQDSSKAIYMSGDTYGAHFGDNELVARNLSLNGSKQCWSLANRNSYKIPIDSEGRNMLTNHKDSFGEPKECYFKIS